MHDSISHCLYYHSYKSKIFLYLNQTSQHNYLFTNIIEISFCKHLKNLSIKYPRNILTAPPDKYFKFTHNLSGRIDLIEVNIEVGTGIIRHVVGPLSPRNRKDSCCTASASGLSGRVRGTRGLNPLLRVVVQKEKRLLRRENYKFGWYCDMHV